MDIIDIKLATNVAINTLSDNGQVGRKEIIVYNFNGEPNSESSFVEIGGLIYARISETIIDPYQINSIRLHTASGDMEFSAGELTITEHPENASPYWTVTAMGFVGVIIYGAGNDVLPQGLYVVCDEIGYIPRIEMKETIHTIDPKYLPGVCLPVVELSTILTPEDVSLTETENALLNNVASTGLPVVARLSIPIGNSSQICKSVLSYIDIDNSCGYLGSIGTFTILLSNSEGEWSGVATNA